MTDITITVDGELMVALVEGQTEAGEEFVDAYLSEEMVVADVGRIVVPDGGVSTFEAQAREAGLVVEKASS